MSHEPRGGATASRGFTLIEVMVGITIGAIVLLGVREACVAVADVGDATLASARAEERAEAGEELLRRTVADMQPDSMTAGGLTGSARGAEFDSWCEMPEGWLERCRATLAVGTSREASGTRLMLRLSTGVRAVVGQGAGSTSLAYLSDPSGGGRWRSKWDGHSPVPLAIGVVADQDTTILPIGVRQ